jgi:streptogramin lyase
MSSQNIRQPIRFFVVIAISLLALIVLLPQRSIQSFAGVSSPAPQSSYLFRFDPASQTFFTYTLPLASLPTDVIVSGSLPAHVWIAEYGLDRIGHLVYTDSDHIEWHEYLLASGSQPFRMTLDGNNLWFTERGANRIGRLNVLTEQIDEFYTHGLSSNAGLANIKVDGNNQVWTTAQWSNELIELIVTDTTDYAFHNYTHSYLVAPFGLAVGSNDELWVTSRGKFHLGAWDLSYGGFSWLPTQTISITSTPTSMPIDLAYNFINQGKPHGELWFTNYDNHSLDFVCVCTYPIGMAFPVGLNPFNLVSESPNEFWITQQDALGSIGRFIFTDTLSTSFVSYPLPIAGLLPTGLALASDGGIWVVAYAPFRLYLPIIFRN